MNPHQLSDAVLQHWIILLASGALGFVIGYIARYATIRHLENQINTTEKQVEACQKASHTQ
ncbi:hypothetical protein GCM10027299_46190 [Larkinella ripae]